MMRSINFLSAVFLLQSNVVRIFFGKAYFRNPEPVQNLEALTFALGQSILSGNNFGDSSEFRTFNGQYGKIMTEFLISV